MSSRLFHSVPSIYEEGDRVPTHLPLSSHHPMINGLNGLCGQGNPATPLRFSKVAVTAYSWVCVIEEEDDESWVSWASLCADVEGPSLRAPYLNQHYSGFLFVYAACSVCHMSTCIPSNMCGLAEQSMTALPCTGHQIIQHCHSFVTNIRQSKSNIFAVISFIHTVLSTHITDNPILHSEGDFEY